MTSEEIKKALTRTWVPFFSRFGSFTPVQELSIPHILAGENVVVVSPAASGKTEAVVAPVIENLMRRHEKPQGLRILYVSPTRALINDLYRRLIDPIMYCGLELGRKTGDQPKLDYDNPPQILLTTPESFDSLMARRPWVFKTLETVVLDEIHLVDNTPRGDQLRVLLTRLRRIKDDLHYYALSATIDDLDIGTRYFDAPRVCLQKSTREIEYVLFPGKNVADRIFETLIKRKLRKVLAFFNARSLAELFSRRFNQPPFLDKVYVHHASLQKQRREEIEQHMNNSDTAILCATSTLELGIDIGDVDCVVLFRPPFDISSLLQRIGRGNRRTNTLFAIGIYTSPWEKILFETFFECSKKGHLYERSYQPALSVIPQQIYSYLYQRRRIGATLKSIKKVMASVYSDEQITDVFRKLHSDGKVREMRPGIYFMTDKMEAKIERGKIHSNIAEVSFGEYDVFDVGTTRIIGRVFHLKKRFILGGRCWETVRIVDTEKRVYARDIGSSPGVAKVFEGKGDGNYAYTLAPVLLKRLYPELKPMEFPYATDGTNTFILHLFGHLYGFILADGLYADGLDALDVKGKMLILNNFQLTDARFPIPKIDSIRDILGRNIARLEDAMSSGAFFYDLSHECRVEDHYLHMDIDGFVEFMRGITLVEIELEIFKSTLQKVQGPQKLP